MSTEKKRIFSVLVANKPGVLSHIAGLFSSRGYNIDSLTVSETEDALKSRMTIVTHGDEATLEPREYYNKLPTKLDASLAIVVDPMLATGGSAVRTCQILQAAGIPRLVFVGLIASPQGVEALARGVPGVAINVAALDDGLNNVGYIIPGLGDAGDRQFGTVPAE